jgi:hypothetical protein
MPTPQEPCFPPGHPGRSDYDARSPEAIKWARENMHPRGERAFPLGHPGAPDTPGNLCSVQWVGGVDPFHPELEPFSGRTPKQAAAARALYESLAGTAKETPVLAPVEAPPPPPPPPLPPPSGQPGE